MSGIIDVTREHNIILYYCVPTYVNYMNASSAKTHGKLEKREIRVAL